MVLRVKGEGPCFAVALDEGGCDVGATSAFENVPDSLLFDMV